MADTIVVRERVAGPGWNLESPLKVMEALMELASYGWEGGIVNEGGVLKLRLSAHGKQTVNAEQGQRLVLDGDTLLVVTADRFDPRYRVDNTAPLPEALVPALQPEPESPAELAARFPSENPQARI